MVNPSTRNLFVVADDDQIIYQWNGASPERLWMLRADYEMEMVQLPENYRCPPAVVDLANCLIAHNSDRLSEKSRLHARKGAQDKIVVRLKDFDDFEQEVDWVTRDVGTRDPEERAKCVVLARTRRLLERVVASLEQFGIPAFMAVRKTEFQSAPLRWLHSILRLANARSNRTYLRLACKSFFTLEGIKLEVDNIVSHASVGDGDLLRSFNRAALVRVEELTPSSRSLLQRSLPRLSDRLDFRSFEKAAFEWFDQIRAMAPDGEDTLDEYLEEKNTWQTLVGEIASKYGEQEVTLHLLLQELDLRSKAPRPPEYAVPCFTIHSSKGMEFDHVYLVGMVEDQLPSWAAIRKGDDSREMQQERRNCFVAITRAQSTLTLSYSTRVEGWSKAPSRFLAEMGLRDMGIPGPGQSPRKKSLGIQLPRPVSR